MNAVYVEEVGKFYNDFRAVDDVTFSVTEGSLFGLLGPNGAGKTTIMRMIMNIIIPDRGQIKIMEKPFAECTKNRIGYLPEERGLYQKMTVIAHLKFLGEMKNLSSLESEKSANNWLERFELSDWANKKVQDLSKGMQQKVQFIGTVMHSPDVLIVDEPFSGLDPINTKFMKDLLLELKMEGKTIILSTHLMDQAEKLCESICLINKGKVVLQGKLPDIKNRYSHKVVQLDYLGQSDFIKQLPIVKEVNDYGNYMEVQLKDNVLQNQFFKELAQSELSIKRFEFVETSLNDIFIEIVEGIVGA